MASYPARMPGFATPEDAVRDDPSVPPRYVRVLAVRYAPDGTRAVVFVEYNEPPAVEPYVVLCEKVGDGWVESSGGSGGGIAWLGTHDDPAHGRIGVATSWYPPTARWNVPHTAVSSRAG
jgi:hypothetical protein